MHRLESIILGDRWREQGRREMRQEIEAWRRQRAQAAKRKERFDEPFPRPGSPPNGRSIRGLLRKLFSATD